MIRYILFDMDGVLVNTEPVHFRIWQEVFKKRGIDLAYDVYKGCIGSTMQYLFTLIYDHYHIDCSKDAYYKEEFYRLKKKSIEDGTGCPPVQGVQEVIPYLVNKGYKIAVASSSSLLHIQNAMEQLGLKDYFTVLFSAESCKAPKPAPDVFLECAKALQAPIKECLVIEDSRNGSIAAKRAGMLCYGYRNPDSGNQNLELADQVFDDFYELQTLL